MLIQIFLLINRPAARLSIYAIIFKKNNKIPLITFIFLRLTVEYNTYLLTDQGCYDVTEKEEGINTCVCDEKRNGMYLTEYFKMFEQKSPFL